MKKKIIILIFILSTIAVTAQKDKRLKGIEKELNSLLETTKAPGLAVAVVEGDKVIYAKGFGYRDFENKIPVDTNTLFAIGSTTKAFTSAILGKLREDKKLSFNDSPRKHIPELEFYNDNMNNNIIIKDLMRHSTGLLGNDDSWYFFPTYNKDSLLQRVKHQKPVTGIRQKWHYNNYMFLAQGVITEKITGKSWEDNIYNYFFKPLNMSRSNASITEMKSATNTAFGYLLDNDGMIRKMNYQDMAGMSPAGSINSSVNDMTKWLKAWINEGKYNDKEIIPTSYLYEAISSQMVSSAVLPNKNSPDIHFANYGYGWNLNSYKGHYRVEHGGNLIGFTASVAFFPTDKLGIVVLTNQNESDVTSLARNIISDRMLKEEKVNWVKRYTENQERIRKMQVETEDENVSFNIKNTKLSHSNIEDYTGNYYNAGYGQFEVFTKKDSLFLYTTDKTRKFYLNHYHYDTFEAFNVEERNINMSWSEFLINFRTDEVGAVSEAMFLASSANPIAFKHIPKIIKVSKSTLKQYVGKYEVSGMTLKVFTKNNNNSLFLYISEDQPEFELVVTEEHKFSFDISEVEIRVEFENPENGVFNELIFIQPNTTFKAIRK